MQRLHAVKPFDHTIIKSIAIRADYEVYTNNNDRSLHWQSCIYLQTWRVAGCQLLMRCEVKLFTMQTLVVQGMLKRIVNLLHAKVYLSNYHVLFLHYSVYHKKASL